MPFYTIEDTEINGRRFQDEEEFAHRLRQLVTTRPSPPPTLRESAARFAWERVAVDWDAAIDAMVLATTADVPRYGGFLITRPVHDHVSMLQKPAGVRVATE